MCQVSHPQTIILTMKTIQQYLQAMQSRGDSDVAAIVAPPGPHCKP